MFSPGKTQCFHSEGTRESAKGPEVHCLGHWLGMMESLTESGVLWSLLLELDSQSLLWYLKSLADAPVGAECYCLHGSEKIPAVSV